MARAAKKKKQAKTADAPAAKPIAKPITQQEVPAVPDGPSADDAQLTIADLQNIAKLIDLATRRGAFGAGEMSDVGVVYDKLSGFLNVIAQQKADADAEGGS